GTRIVPAATLIRYIQCHRNRPKNQNVGRENSLSTNGSPTPDGGSYPRISSTQQNLFGRTTNAPLKNTKPTTARPIMHCAPTGRSSVSSKQRSSPSARKTSSRKPSATLKDSKINRLTSGATVCPFCIQQT